MNRKYNDYSDVVRNVWHEYVEGLCLPGDSSIVIFGCGDIGKRLLSYMSKEMPKKVVCVCDNNKDSWGKEIEGYIINSPEEAVRKYGKAVFVIAALRSHEVIRKQLITMGLDEDSIKALLLNESGVYRREYLSERLGDNYILDYDFPAEPAIPVIHPTSEIDKRDFRIYIEEGLGHKLDTSEGVLDKQFMDDYERSYGKYIRLDELPKTGKKNKTNILVACSHKDYGDMKWAEEEMYSPIQVGKALTDIDLYNLKDNVGDNISDRNYNYCECSALYWAWKNDYLRECDYLGLRHYRRRFEATDDDLKYLMENEIDIVHLDPIYHDNIRYSFYNHTKNENDWDIMKNGIKEVFPDYYPAMIEYENQHFVCGYNMNILRRDIFDEYCEFLFGVLFYVEDYYLAKCDRRDRYLGFLAENLFGVFLIKNRDNYKYAVTKLVPHIEY